ncbi:unnamed protein product [Prorocentrum cordatum]|uniref:Uncharacterized protein n=1 Tax=Prorocentrum cordatum TaxID=2364126 RepID=A0ABN9WGP2_9DINO|nr:unnamed protein product [Polarella glacialis]
MKKSSWLINPLRHGQTWQAISAQAVARQKERYCAAFLAWTTASRSNFVSWSMLVIVIGIKTVQLHHLLVAPRLLVPGGLMLGLQPRSPAPFTDQERTSIRTTPWMMIFGRSLIKLFGIRCVSLSS